MYFSSHSVALLHQVVANKFMNATACHGYPESNWLPKAPEFRRNIQHNGTTRLNLKEKVATLLPAYYCCAG